MPEPVYTSKGVEELVVGQLVPSGTVDPLVIDAITPIDPTYAYGAEGISYIPIGFKVEFTDGTFVIYPTGSVVRSAPAV